MAEITINGVKYTNVPNKKAGTKFAASLTQSNIGASQAVQDYVNSAYFYPLVNAIDINWNGVEVEENSYINTTSDLISYIASKESNVDLSSYATMAYVDQKITDLIGGAPETLDTLKELADALADDASLAYVTQALDGKADKSSLTNYATNSYVTTELDKKADKSEIPSMPDLTPYISYEQANSYYVKVTGNQNISGTKTFFGDKPISFKQSAASNKLGFVCFDTDGNDVGGLEYRPNTINGKALLSLQHYVIKNNSDIEQSYLGFRQTRGNYKYHLLAPIPADVATIETITNSNYKNFFMPLVFKNGSNKVYTDCTGLVDMASLMPDLSSYATTSYVTTELDKKANKSEIPSMPDLTPYVSYEQANSYYAYKSDIPDMSNYVSVSSYNALVARVEELASWIVSYHSGSEPTPEPTYEFHYDNYYTNISPGSTVTPVIVNTYPYTNITYTSNDNSIFTVDSNGTCTGKSLGTADLTAELYDNSNNLVTSTTSVVIVGKLMPVAYWSFNGTALPDNELVVLPYDTLTQSTYTFYSDPATGWSVGDTLYETPGITIDNSTHVITVDPTSFEHAGKGRAQVDYNEDATYQQKSYSIEFRILAQGADTEFYFDEDEVNVSQNYTTTTRHLSDNSGLMEQGYNPTFTIGNPSYVSVAQSQDDPNEIEFTWLAEGETIVTATITDGNETHSATVTVHCVWDRDWIDGHVYTSQNNEVNYEYGIVQSGSNPSLTFTASNGNTQDPMNGDLFEVSISNDTNNIISYTSTSSGLTISFDNNATQHVGDEINMTIIKQQDTTYGYYSKDLRFKVVHAGNDPLLWWNSDTFTVTENDVFSQSPITNWLSNQIIDFSTWETLTPTLSITNGDGAAHLDQDNVLHGDSVGAATLTATVTDLNNNTHTATALVHVEAAS